jgi:DNA (cytosine-5)-methyltransferase 1
LSGIMMVQTTHKTGPWSLSDLKDIESNGYKVFSCFHCGGGSSMGYKLSGFDVLGGVEIDPEMMKVYKINHNPKHSYLMGVQDFNKIPNSELPKELFDLDILDGSPPCSSFSMAGSREKAWGKKKKFREGQAVQVLDDLFFHFIETARKLQPKIVVAENVKGLITGKAKGYVKQIAQMLNHAGYDLQLFLLNSAFMGVPQKRERTFFIAKRKGLDLPKLVLNFNERPIPFKDVKEPINIPRKRVNKSLLGAGAWCKRNGTVEIVKWNIAVNKKNTLFTQKMTLDNEPVLTQTSSQRHIYCGTDFFVTDKEIIRCQTFPEDYNFIKMEAQYICGMSVPPYMMNRVSKQIQLQWLDKL